jgi:hypothetical membrane protein
MRVDDSGARRRDAARGAESSRPQIDVPSAMLVVGSLGLLVGIGTIAGAAMAYAAEREFSVFTTYISDFGSAGGWAQAIFSTGMLIAAPLRYLFLVLLLAQLVHLGTSPRLRTLLLVVGAFVVLGSVGTAAVPFTLHLRTHMGSAFLYFLGTVVLQSALAVQERRLRLPALLPLSSMAVVVVYFVFAGLLALVGRVDAVDRHTPVPWEWLAFAALMVWLAAHTFMLGSSRPTQG